MFYIGQDENVRKIDMKGRLSKIVPATSEKGVSQNTQTPLLQGL